MNVLLVDDQRTIVDSLKQGIRWSDLSVDKVYCALSAKEAQMILRNFEIHVLLTDIEMPEGDGLSLFAWAKENDPDIEGIFLTSHADFAYAQRAIHMGGFDYVLQPVRFEDVEAVLRRVKEKVDQREAVSRLESAKTLVKSQKNNILDGILHRIENGDTDAANQAFKAFPELFGRNMDEVTLYPILVELAGRRQESAFGERSFPQILNNLLEDLFASSENHIAVSSLDFARCWALLIVKKGSAGQAYLRQNLESLHRFLQVNLELRACIYPAEMLPEQEFSGVVRGLKKRADSNADKKGGLFLSDADGDEPEEKEEDSILRAKQYIMRNLNKNIARADVADEVFLNEEYFSRLFRQQTGYTFKDYVMMEKMNLAKKLLTESRLSISIIASKVGYDNFSHFSKMFKKIVNQTPQEYRKKQQK